MKNSQIIALFKRNAGMIMLIGLLLSALTFLFLVVNEKNFKASTTFLVIQNQTGQQDFYSLSKSTEYISRIISESITSELFIAELINTGQVKSEFLPLDKKKRLEEWNKIINIKMNSGLGIISIDIKSNTQKEALLISQATAVVLTEKNKIFRGDKDEIAIKILSGPIVEKNPGLTKMIMAVFGSLALGLLIGAAGVYYFKKEDIILLSDYNNDEEYKESLKYLGE